MDNHVDDKSVESDIKAEMQNIEDFIKEVDKEGVHTIDSAEFKGILEGMYIILDSFLEYIKEGTFDIHRNSDIVVSVISVLRGRF